MPGGVMNVESGTGVEFSGKLTKQVVICSIIAACGGLMFGYDIGISGGVTSMDDFLLKFFPAVYFRKHHAKENNYCKYDNPYLQLFTSSLYLAAIVASFFASLACRKIGRKKTILGASVFFLVGSIMNAAARNIATLICGRIFLGAGIGFGNQAVPLFISEIAPAKYRGALNISFQMLITVGILLANVINYGTSRVHPYGWRISLGGAAIPALILLIGSIFIVETPTSLIERGKKEKGLATLRKIRGVKDVEIEFEEICGAVELTKRSGNSFRNLMKRNNRPKLYCAVLLHMLQQLTGINIIMFYAPVLFQTMGFGSDASLLSAVVTGLVNVCATVVAIFTVDRLGRRVLLIEGAIQMLIGQLIMGIILTIYLKATNEMPDKFATVVVVLVCVFVTGFAWSWGPLGWLIASEMFPLPIRNSGYFFAVSTNMLFTFIIAQLFLTMLCHMRSGIFFFFSALLITMCCFAIFLLPETKGIPIDEMEERAWRSHWFWKRYSDDVEPRDAKGEIQPAHSKPEDKDNL